MVAAQPRDEPEVSLPASLYKYCPPERIDILENMALRFSPPAEFNDTFDSHYLVPKARGARAKIERHQLRNRLGILCLTERSDDHVMWVHYAHNHTGFVLGFDTKAPFFREEGRILRKVDYQSRPNVLPTADMNACFYKSLDWQHEKEWRCVREFKPSEFRLIPIEPAAITAIIFGHRMESWRIA